MASKEQLLESIRADVGARLDEIEAMFKPEYGVKITLILRSPLSTETELVITSETSPVGLDEAIQAIERAKGRPRG